MQRAITAFYTACLAMSLAACGGHPGGDIPGHVPRLQDLLEQQTSPSSHHETHGTCVGTPEPCAWNTDSGACRQVSGCHVVEATCEAKLCAAYSDAASCRDNRCRWRFLCGGQAERCYHAGRDACTHQAGCTWLAAEGMCSGVERSCNTLEDPISCAAQAGCGMVRGCTESLAAPSCLMNDTEAKCLVNNACTWKPALCEGHAAPCGVHRSPAACDRAPGCSWL